MKKPMFISNSISINVSAAKVWEWLVNPEKTRQYMFGCEAISDWKKGSSLLWRGMRDGKDRIFVKGDIEEIQPGKLLKYTVIDPTPDIDDVPENYLTVTYELTEKDGQTHFTVRQGDYSTVADGERRYRESYNNGEGWNPILIEIKKLVESD